MKFTKKQILDAMDLSNVKDVCLTENSVEEIMNKGYSRDQSILLINWAINVVLQYRKDCLEKLGIEK